MIHTPNFLTPRSFGRRVFASFDPTAGLSGYWKFDETSGNAADSSGAGNNGVWYGTGSHYVGGHFSNAGGFNGTDDYNTPGNATMFGWQTLTYAFWFYQSASNSSGTNQTMLTAGGRNEVEFSSTDVLRATLYNGSFININSGMSGLAGAWHHVAMALGGGVARLYVDGVYKAQATGLGTIVYSGTDRLFAFGGQASGAGAMAKFCPCLIDDARVYNITLSDDDVTSLYGYTP